MWPFSESSREKYDAISSIVYERLNDMLPYLRNDVRLEEFEEKLSNIESNLKDIDCKDTVEAYRFWIPRYKRQAARYKEYNLATRNMKKYAKDTPVVSTTKRG
jgi:hypothetical protein